MSSENKTLNSNCIKKEEEEEKLDYTPLLITNEKFQV